MSRTTAPPAPPVSSMRRRASRLREEAAVAAGRCAGVTSRLTGRGGGTTLPGRVALVIDPHLLRELTHDRPVVVVSGTNGKTTTTRFLAAAVATRQPVVTNDGGANLLSGLASALLSARRDRTSPAVLEVDEFALTPALAAITVSVVVLLNLSRDQLDRGGEVSFHVARWGLALALADQAVVVANADDPLVCAAVSRARPDGAGVVWVSAGSRWHGDVPLCPRCHAPWRTNVAPWRCTACGFARPEVTWAVDDGALVLPTGRRLPVHLALPGRVNVANAAMAAAAADCLQVPADAAVHAMEEVRDVAGRYLQAVHQGQQVRLLLAKNPAGWTETLDLLDGGDGPVVLAVNARTADGADTSWLWDVPFERLAGRHVVAAGNRAADVSLRLLYAGVRHSRQPDALAAAVRAGATTPGVADVVANYTAFAEVRNALGGHPAHRREDAGVAVDDL